MREANMGDAAGISRVHVDAWRTTYRGVVPDSYLNAMSYKEYEARWRGQLDGDDERTFSFVAEVSGEIAGFASGGPRRSESLAEYDGELYALYLRREQKGGGLGRRLFEVVVRKLPDVGCRKMVARVMAENLPARAFYEALGGTLLGNDEFEIEGARIEEVAYGWRDVSRF